MTEVWASIEGHESYSVSTLGRVRNQHTGFERSRTLDSNGYRRLNIYSKGTVISYYIHRLVAKAFLPDFRPGVMISFRNEDRSDCRVENLIVKETIMMTRERLGTPKFLARQVRIIELDMVFRTAIDAANHIGGDPTAIYKCLRGERRMHRGYTFETQTTQQALEYHRRRAGGR